MKKQLKRIGALALALVFALCLMLPAFAENGNNDQSNTEDGTTTGAATTETGSITINGVQAGKTYDIYRIFDLTANQDDKGTVTGYSYKIADAWKNFFIKGTSDTTDPAGATYLVKKTGVEETDKTYTDAECNELTYENTTYFIYITDTNVVPFAQAALTYITKCTANFSETLNDEGTSVATTSNDTNYNATSNVTLADNSLKLSNVALGYYLVYPVGASVKKSNSSGSICSLDTTNVNMTVNLKAEYPTIDKTVTGVKEGAVVGIGDTVTFTITGTVPDTTGYKSYTYKITDTMSDGLEYNDLTSIVVGKDDDAWDLTKETTTSYYTLTPASDNKSFTLTIAVEDLQTVANSDGTTTSHVGDDIVVTYTAKVTAAAAGDNIKNDAKLTYSNDPNSNGEGETDKATTPDDNVQLYTVNVQVYAYTGEQTTDQKDYAPGTPLAGAQYVLQNSEGKYYNWNDSTGVEWVESIDDALHLVTDKDGLTKEITASEANSESTAGSTSESTPTSNQTSDTSQPVVASSDENGEDETLQANDNSAETSKTETGTEGTTTTEKTETAPVASATFKGLAAGDYTLKEVVTPAGYNTALDTPFTVEARTPTDTDTDKRTAITKDAEGIYINDTYLYQYNIQHKTGSVLPSTGGMGTTLFYVIGAALVIGAGVLLVVRRRMGDEE